MGTASISSPSAADVMRHGRDGVWYSITDSSGTLDLVAGFL